MRRTALTALALLAVLGLAAGCGGDDESAEETTTTTSEGAGSDEETTTTEDSGDDGGGGVGAFTSEECEQFAEAFDQLDIGDAVTTGEDPTAELEAAAQQLSDAASKAPDEVRGDIETLADFYERLAEASADVDWEGIRNGNPAAVAGAAQFGQQFASEPDVVTASQNLATWAQENCVPAG